MPTHLSRPLRIDRDPAPRIPCATHVVAHGPRLRSRILLVRQQGTCRTVHVQMRDRTAIDDVAYACRQAVTRGIDHADSLGTYRDAYRAADREAVHGCGHRACCRRHDLAEAIGGDHGAVEEVAGAEESGHELV